MLTQQISSFPHCIGTDLSLENPWALLNLELRLVENGVALVDNLGLRSVIDAISFILTVFDVGCVVVGVNH